MSDVNKEEEILKLKDLLSMGFIHEQEYNRRVAEINGENDTFQQPSPVDPYQQPSPIDPYQQPSPVDPYQQPSPIDPYQQPSPVDPYQQPSPVDPYQRSSPLDPYQRSSPVDPNQQPSPVDPYQRSSPLDPYQRSSPLDPYQRSSPVDPYQRSSPVDTTHDPYAMPPAFVPPTLSHYSTPTNSNMLTPGEDEKSKVADNTDTSTEFATKDEYIIYGKNVAGIVVYYSSSAGTIQTPVITNACTLADICHMFTDHTKFRHPKTSNPVEISSSSDYYLENIFDGTKLTTLSTNIPHGQYHLKKLPKLRACGSGVPMFCYESSSTKYHENHEQTLGNVFSSRFTHHNPGAAVLVILKTYPRVMSFEANTLLRDIRASFGCTASILKSCNDPLCTYSKDDLQIPKGDYVLEQPSFPMPRAEKTLFLNPSRYDFQVKTNALPKGSTYPPIQAKRVPFENGPPWWQAAPVQSKRSSDKITELITKLKDKPTRSFNLKSHFFIRTRYLQQKANSLGRITARIRNSKCIISGKDVPPDTLMHPDHKDSTIETMYRQLVKEGMWENVIFADSSGGEASEVPVGEAGREPGGPVPSREPEGPVPSREPGAPVPSRVVLHSGSAHYEPNTKFQYISPQHLPPHNANVPQWVQRRFAQAAANDT